VAFEDDDGSDAGQEPIEVGSDDRQLGVPAAKARRRGHRNRAGWRRIGTGPRRLAIQIRAVMALRGGIGSGHACRVLSGALL